jgi:hypothetical protein
MEDHIDKNTKSEEMKKEAYFISPSEFYRQRHPEFFSDSEDITDIILPKEVLAYEIEKISANQKQDLFETLCRRLAEKFICPNLIPQVGPTGGGDGKTDAETYSVSRLISERWFIPRDGWKNDEKWAFAFSAKENWKAKVELDVKKITNTGRGYTKVFFISNQTISSKKKKDEQDVLSKKHGIDVIILDAVWIIENIYKKDLTELVAETLNMSDVYRTSKKRLGKNDSERLSELEEIEKKIEDTQYYSSNDTQLLHDAIRSAVLSRMLELPRDEVEAKFARAERLCKTHKTEGLLTKIIYQKAWTYINYYDDYSEFVGETIKLKELINEKSSNIAIEWLFNILNLYRSIHFTNSDDIQNSDIFYKDFESHCINVLSLQSQNQEMPCSALLAKTYLAFIDLVNLTYKKEDASIPLKNLSEIILESKKYIEYPLEAICQLITEIGIAFADNAEYDALIESLADISGSRESEISSGIVYFNRGVQKFKTNKFKESIIYFGKSVFKLAKEETSDYLIFSLLSLSKAYEKLALPWAAYNCLVIAASFEIKKWFEGKKITKRLLSIIWSLLRTEILLGRLPNIFLWYELFVIIYRQFDDAKNEIPDDIFFDGCLAVRLLHIDQKDDCLTYLPNILDNLELSLSNDAVLFLLGYEEKIIEHYKDDNIKNVSALESFFQKVYAQPLNDQFFFQTEFQNSDILVLKTIIIGCNIIFEFDKNKNMIFLVETILASLESILATSVGKIVPLVESIFVRVSIDNNIDYFFSSKDDKTNKVILKVNLNNIFAGDHDLKVESFLKVFAFILGSYFHTESIHEYLDGIFREESVNERMAFAFNHKQSFTNIMGDNPRVFFDDWKDGKFIYTRKRLSPIIFHQNVDTIDQNSVLEKKTFEDTPHNKFIIHSIIDDSLWDKAGWKATGILVSHNIAGLALGFKNFDVGKKIFEGWKNLIGKIDKNELIDISIIKGVNKYNPSWYRVIVTTNQERTIINDNKFHIVKSRIHEMNANNSKNMNMFENAFRIFKSFILFPSPIELLLPEHLKFGILKTKITIKNAWQIGINDPIQVAIHDTDVPILPEGITDIPVLSLLKQKKENRKGASQ